MTDIVEIDLPCWVLPKEPYYIEELELVILPSNIDLPKSEYFKPQKATKLIFYGTNLENERIKEITCSLIKFMTFLYTNHTLFEWLIVKNVNNLLIYKKNILSLENHIKELYEKPKFIIDANYDEYPLMQFSSNPDTVNFRELFLKYYHLDNLDENQSKIKELIDFFSMITSSQSLLSKIYSNTNFRISNTFAIIETLINMEIEDQTGFKKCPNCGESIPSKKTMNELIELFIESKNIREENKKAYKDILKKHYNVRNQFFHNTTNLNVFEKAQEVAEKNKGVLSLENEIKYANGGFIGLQEINNLIRKVLIGKL